MVLHPKTLQNLKDVNAESSVRKFGMLREREEGEGAARRKILQKVKLLVRVQQASKDLLVVEPHK